jgi:hypothetical protein
MSSHSPSFVASYRGFAERVIGNPDSAETAAPRNSLIYIVADKGGRDSLGAPTNMGFSGFLHVPCTWKLLLPWLP